MKQISIPSFDTRGTGAEFAYCKGSKVTSSVKVNDIIQQYQSSASAKEPNIIAAIEAFSCSALGSNQLVECKSREKVKSLCTDYELVAIWKPEMDTELADVTGSNDLMLRVVYEDIAAVVTPAVGLIYTEIETTAHEGHYTDKKSSNKDITELRLPTVERDDSWKLTWPQGKIGQTSGVAAYDKDHVFVFHRADRSWGRTTFDRSFNFYNKTKIDSDTILKCEVQSGKCVESFGSDMFLLPHGISVTPDRKFLLVTDVGRHQASAVEIETGKEVLTLGTFGVPLQGDEPDYLCQPADAEMDPETGLIFVADGYCNKRVAVFNNDGSYNMSIKKCMDDKDFYIVHDLAIDSENRVLFVADRENGRICVYSIDKNNLGKPLGVREEFPNTVYAVDYNPGNLYSTQWTRDETSKYGLGSIIPTVGKLAGQEIEKFRDSQMKDPHDISVWDNTYIFISDLQSNQKVFKYVRKDVDF